MPRRQAHGAEHYSRGCGLNQLPTTTRPIHAREGTPQTERNFFKAGYHRSMDEKCAPAPSQPEAAGNTSGRTVHCAKFQKDLPGLDAPPWPGELGRRVYEKVSAQAWKLWEERMKMILNEYRLMPWQKEAQDLVVKHMEDFFFGEGAALPPGYVPQQAK